MKLKHLMLTALLCALSWGAAPSTTTLQSAITGGDGQLVLASVTGVSAGYELYIDSEAMRVSSISGKAVQVYRGIDGTRTTPHAAGATVYAGPAWLFVRSALAGSCDNSTQTNTLLDVTTGYQWTCTAGAWVSNAASSGSGGTGVDPVFSVLAYNASTMAPACTAHAPSTTFTVALTGNVSTFTAPSGCAAGQKITFKWTQDATGGRTVTYPSDFTAPAPVDLTALKTTSQTFTYVGASTFTADGPAAYTSTTAAMLLNSGNVVLVPDANDTVVTLTATQALTNKTIDAEATGNTITTTSKPWLPATACAGTTATLLWDTLAALAPTGTCSAGTTETNLMRGKADFPDSDGDYSLQISFLLPDDWTGLLDLKFLWLAAATSGNVVWQAAESCSADGEVRDAAFGTASTVTDAAKGTTLQLNTASITGINPAGCAAGEIMTLKVFRNRTHASDTITGTVSLVGVQPTIRRAQ